MGVGINKSVVLSVVLSKSLGMNVNCMIYNSYVNAVPREDKPGTSQ
jgi:hypothetical protein